MLALDEHEIRKLLTAAGELGDAMPGDVDIQWLFGVLAALVPSDTVSWSRLDKESTDTQQRPAHLSYAATCGDDSPQMFEAFWACYRYHPTCGRTWLPDIVAIGDVLPHLQWTANPLFHEYFRAKGLEHVLNVRLDHPIGQTNVVMFERSPGRDFDDRDHLVMALLRPHLAAAIRRLTTQPHLTARELQVLELVRDGYTNSQVARALHVSATTVRTHLEHIYSKLGVHSRTEAVKMGGLQP